MVVTLGQQYHVGEKPTVILYTYVSFRFVCLLVVVARLCAAVCLLQIEKRSEKNNLLEPYELVRNAPVP